MWHFAPTLILPAGPLELPRPVTQLRVQDAWDMARLKVPRVDGTRVVGRSRAGVEIALRGRLAAHEGRPRLGETAMLETLESIRQALNLGDPEAAYGLGLYRDEVDPARFKGFRDCSTLRFEYDLSDHAVFGYSLLVHASDPVLSTGGLT